MGKIHRLDSEIINLIAAGEVVERPASVVKELMENSIDAGATKILVNIKDSGFTNITVVDNGQGMDEQDAELAFAQHATSKVATAEDLHQISTLGFRGEALASISSVAEIEIQTKTLSDEGVHKKIRSEAVETLVASQADPGTTLSISNLFANLPARKKFLRSEATEYTHIVNTFISIALVNLGIHFELHHNGKLTYRLPAVQNLPDRIFEIWGAQTSANLYHTTGEFPGIRLSLYAGSPDIARKDRKLQYIFVNGRSISDRMLQRAVTEAYKGFIHRDLQPVYFALLDIDPALVDVNVHPRKQEVRFADTQQMYSILYNSVRRLLEKSTKQELLSRIEPTRTETLENITDIGRITNNHQLTTRSHSPRTDSRQLTAKTQPSLDFTAELLKSVDQPMQFRDVDSAPITDISSSPAISYIAGPTQLFNTYIVYQQGESVVFVDQHAAAEKILYEKLILQADISKSRPLLIPQVLEFSSHTKQQILERSQELLQLGLEINDFGSNSLQISAVPELAPNLDVERFLQEFVDENAAPRLSKIEQDVNLKIATMACHGSIRAGQKLSVPEMINLLQDLAKCTQPYNCPHGRPVSWQMTRSELEKNFKRII